MSTNCTPIAKSLEWCKGTPVLPGIRDRVYRINKAKIAAWPTLTKDNTGRVTAAKYTGDFVLVTGAVFDVIDVLADKSQLTSEAQGECPSQTQLNKLTLVHPLVDETAGEFVATANNSDDIYLVPTADGKYRVVGCEMYPSKTTISQDLGQGATGTASTTINVEASDVIPAPFYEGEIVTAGGIINETVTHTVAVSCTQGDGTVTIDAETPAASVTKTIKHGRTVTIVAAPASGKIFNKWSDNVTNATRQVTILGDTTLSATFTTAQAGE